MAASFGFKVELYADIALIMLSSEFETIILEIDIDENF
jgi:hypothetical protein